MKNLLAYAIPEMLSFFQATTKAPTAGFANNGRTAADSPHLLTLNNTGAAGVIRVVRSQQRHGFGSHPNGNAGGLNTQN